MKNTHLQCSLAALVSAATLGLALQAQPAQPNYFDPFEDPVINPFWTLTEQHGTVTLSSLQAHSEAQAVKLTCTSWGQKEIALVHKLPQPDTGTVSVWFHDGGFVNLYSKLELFNSVIGYPNPGSYFLIGAEDYNWAQYLISFPAGNRWVGQRSLGWHHFEIVLSDSGYEFSLDGVVVGSGAGPCAFDTISLSLRGPGGILGGSHFFDDFAMIRDSQPPEVTAVTASRTTLWPPNGQLVPVEISVQATDDRDPAPRSRIIGVSSNEPDNEFGDGNTDPDWDVVGDLAVLLRAERSGLGTGRIYTVSVETSDAAGNMTTSSLWVTVPHDQRRLK